MIDITFLIKPSEINTKGQCIIYCRFKCGSTPKKEISTGIQVLPDEFDTATKRILTKGKKSGSDLDNIKEKNNTLNVLETRLRQIYNRQIDAGITPTAQTVKEEFEAKKERRTFLQAIDLLKKKLKDNVALTKKINITYKVVELFIKDKYKVDNIYLNEIENYLNFADDFEQYVKAGGNKRKIAWSRIYLKKIFSYIKRSLDLAVKQKWLKVNYLADHKIILTKQDRTKDKIFLTKQELSMIIQCDYNNLSLKRIADIFVFQCLTGLAYIDVKALTYKDIRVNAQGIKYIHKPRTKSATYFTIPLSQTALDLIEKYKSDIHREVYHADRVFPVKTNKTYNLHLKTIAEILNINKVLKTHVARYTCNQLMYEAGVSDEVRKQILGHTTVNMTAHYTTASTVLMNEAIQKIKV